MRAQALSDLATSFPSVEVAYEDLLTYRHRTDARGERGEIDCLGVVLEVYRRAGLRLPDPKLAGSGITEWHRMFSEVPAPDQLYDVIHVRRNVDHVWVVVRPGTAIASSRGTGVTTIRIAQLTQIRGTKSYRLRPEFFP